MPASQTNQGDGQRLQLEILQKLQRVIQRLDQVEERMSTTARTTTPDKPDLSSDTFLESIKPSKKLKYVSSSSSSDESDVPSLELLKSSRFQRKVDKRIKDLNQSSRSTGKLTYKCLRGGEVDV